MNKCSVFQQLGSYCRLFKVDKSDVLNIAENKVKREGSSDYLLYHYYLFNINLPYFSVLSNQSSIPPRIVLELREIFQIHWGPRTHPKLQYLKLLLDRAREEGAYNKSLLKKKV
mgnify:CR=1 FL=1|tara:strand:- start:7700 stop:8041 length:342 start_codon:yes stop_codon:yes gene_type:complete